MKYLLIVLTFMFAASASAQDYLELLRQDIKTTKVAILTEALPMTQKESDAFWPIYREYDLSLSKIADRRIGGIKKYAKVYDKMTDSAATALVQEGYKLQKDRLDLLMNVFKKVSKATNPQLAARFIQIENQIITLLDMKIIEEVPLLEKGPKKSGTEKK
jgi:hypothetical protein